jgi:cytochrome c
MRYTHVVRCLITSFAALVGVSTSAMAQAPSEFRGHGGPVKAVAILADGATLVTGGFDSSIIAWDTHTGSARRVLRFHDSTVNAIAAVSATCFASGGEDAKIAVWCGDAPAPQRILSGHTAPITHLAVSPDGRWLASASFDRTVRLWPLDPSALGTGSPPDTLDGFASPVAAVAFLPNSQGVITGSYDGTVAINTWTGAAAPQPLNFAVPVNAVARRPGGGFAIAGADGHVRTLTPELAVRDDLDVGSGPLTTLAVSPDGTRLATAGMRTQVTMVDTARAAMAFEILGPGLPVWSLAFSPDGRELYTGGQDRAVRRWDAATGGSTGRDLQPMAVATLPFPDDPGARVFKACAACHGVTPDETAKAGPSLAGIFGRRIGTAPGYAYSPALKALDIVWSRETITELFVRGPAAYTPGSKMPEQTLTNPADCAALVTWLEKVTAPQ